MEEEELEELEELEEEELEDEEEELEEELEEEEEEELEEVVGTVQLWMEKDPVQLKVAWEMVLLTPAHCLPGIVPL